MKRWVLLIGFVCFCTSNFAQNVLYRNDKIISKSLAERWELEPEFQKGTFRLTSYKPFYITAGRWSSNPNKQPQSENPNYTVPTPTDYNNYEAKFQLSFKTKVLQSIFWGHGDLWLAYTQRAHWQIYNTSISRPFRELNYEPELMLNFGIRAKILGFDARTLGISMNHQSNGRDLPRSRSWNRIIFHAGLERGNWILVFRPWVRLPDEEDENPLISDFIGRAEANVIYTFGNHSIYLITTNSLSIKNNRGSAQLNYVFPIRANLRGHFQIFDGYGETMIDYNHRQTTIGLGISFVDW
ncbi:phospholipase A [Algoriphagus algorifonticola]|uniref:phospholipase A n=1 Tax=Algoriphagus algorifonticola TaxID=2593007 RepID=UPI0011A6BACB|nr:phospholipase A [Algoriphagus algorifonticola]